MFLIDFFLINRKFICSFNFIIICLKEEKTRFKIYKNTKKIKTTTKINYITLLKPAEIDVNSLDGVKNWLVPVPLTVEPTGIIAV